MKKYSAALAASLVLAAGCKDSATVPPFDAPTTGAINGALTKTGLQTLALGLLAQDRAAIGGAANYSYLILPEIYARDAFRIDASEPRYVTETLSGTPDPGGFSGSGGFTGFYTAIRAANTLLAALPNAVADQVTDKDKAATAGLARTIKAINYYRALELRDTVGIAIQPAANDSVGPIVCKETAINYIAALLDSALTDFNTAGPTAKLPFTVPTGFTTAVAGADFTSVANLIKFNRGYKGKVDVYRGLDHKAPNAAAFTAAIAELTIALDGAAPGAVPSSRFAVGPYFTFVASGVENTANPIADSKIGLNPNVAASIEAGDTRASKIVTRSALTGNGLTTTTTYVGASTANASNTSRPLAILRVEEEVLLRAQAYFEAGQFANGYADLNSVRTSYGLAPRAVSSSLAQARTDLLYEKRYSLLFEGPQRLVDLRAYGIKPAATGLPNEVYNLAMPIPKPEADARNGNIAPTCS